MTFLQPAIALIATTCLLSCTMGKLSAARPRSGSHQVRGWPDKEYDQVIGYRFTDLDDAWSLLNAGSGELNERLLNKVKRKQFVLSQGHVEQLFKAIGSTDPKERGFNCYNPHHIFVFYSNEVPVGAFEICFECSHARAWPEPRRGLNPSYARLHVLCRELGLESNHAGKDKQ